MLLQSLTQKLRLHSILSDGDVRAIECLPIDVRQYEPHALVVCEGQRPEHCCVIMEGFLARAKNDRDGKRQILSIHIPGEIPDLQSLHLPVMDHDIWTLSSSHVGLISHKAMRRLTSERPNVLTALWRETLVDAALFREAITNVGRRNATTRTAHLLLEMKTRLQAIGMAQGDEYILPMTQSDLADTLGLSIVHVNRVLQALRARGLVLKRDHVRLGDEAKLAKLGEFDPRYLHQSQKRRASARVQSRPVANPKALQRWSVADDRKLRTLLRGGESPSGAALALGRTHDDVMNRIAYLTRMGSSKNLVLD